jgi:hypothetical protein
MRGIETIVIRVAAVCLSAVGDFGNPQLAQYWGTPTNMIS